MVSNEFIRFLTDKLYQQAAAKPGYDGAPYQRIEPEDVRNGGEQPLVRDTGEVPPTAPEPNDTPSPTPTPTPTPTATPSSGPDWTDPGTSAPTTTTPSADSIIDSAFDWGFPEITVNLGSGTCPIYTADFFGHTLTLDSHCPFIEQNRAIISAMMLLLFTIAAGIIVLRA